VVYIPNKFYVTANKMIYKECNIYGGKNMQVSKSKIKTLEICPLMFKFKYLDERLPDTPSDVTTQIGLQVHNIFNIFYDNIKLDEIPEQPYRYFYNVMKVPIHFENIYKKFCEFNTKRWKEIPHQYFMPLFREKYLSVDNFHGIIDRIDYDGRNYCITDYKGRVNMFEQRFELNFYKMLVDESKMLDKPVKYIGVYGYLDGRYVVEEVREHDYNKMIDKINAFMELDLEQIEYLPRRGYHCKWCEYRRSCNENSSICE